MSYNFEGKLANQSPKCINLTTIPKYQLVTLAKSRCEKCSKLIEFPKREVASISNRTFLIFSYLDTNLFIYETKSGQAVVYCSEYCKNKHNHRFNKS